MEPISDRQHQILDAASEVFVRFGFRKASMQDIAEAAGLSRAALYLHFRNKEDVFRSGLQRLYAEALTVAEAALAGEGGFAVRLEGALTGYAEVMLAPAQGSPHGADLFAAHDSLAGSLSETARSAFLALLVTAITTAEAAGEIDSGRLAATPGEVAQTLYDALDGVKSGYGDAAAIAACIRTLARAFARGLAV